MIETEWRMSICLRREISALLPRIDAGVTFVIGRMNDSPSGTKESVEASRLSFQIA